MSTRHLLDDEGAVTCTATSEHVTSDPELTTCQECKPMTTTTMTAADMLALHKEVWDMPTLAEQHPEILQHLSESFTVVFPEDFSGQVYVQTKDTHAMRKMGTTDVRVAVQTLLEEEAAERLLESHGATTYEDALAAVREES